MGVFKVGKPPEQGIYKRVHPGYILDGSLYFGWDKPDPNYSLRLRLEEDFDARGFEGIVEFELDNRSNRHVITTSFWRIR